MKARFWNEWDFQFRCYVVYEDNQPCRFFDSVSRAIVYTQARNEGATHQVANTRARTARQAADAGEL